MTINKPAPLSLPPMPAHRHAFAPEAEGGERTDAMPLLRI